MPDGSFMAIFLTACDNNGLNNESAKEIWTVASKKLLGVVYTEDGEVFADVYAVKKDKVDEWVQVDG